MILMDEHAWIRYAVPVMLDLAWLELSVPVIVGLMALIGFYGGRLTRRTSLPSIVGYMIVGVLIGPSVLHLLSVEMIARLDLLSEVGLGFVGFAIGSELRLSSLQKMGRGLALLIFVAFACVFLVVMAAVYAFTGDAVIALIFGSLAPASAPAGTVAVIQEYHAKGDLTRALYAVVGFDDGLAILVFGFATAIARMQLTGAATDTAFFSALAAPVFEVLGSLFLGAMAGFLFCRLVRIRQSPGEIILVLFAFVLVVTGLAVRWHLSFILTNMLVGFTLANTQNRRVRESVGTMLRRIMPTVYVLFFCLAGAHLQLQELAAIGALGMVYLISRTAGKLLGGYLGGTAGGLDRKIRLYVGPGLLSQAGVAIGLALVLQNDLSRLAEDYGLPEAAGVGALVLSVVTVTSIIFEIIGPIGTKFALQRAGEIK